MDPLDPPNEPPEARVPENKTPEILTSSFSLVLQFVQQNGWFIIIAIIALAYLWSKYRPTFDQWQKNRDEASAYKKLDSEKMKSRMEAQEESRRKLQEKFDAQAESHKEKMKEIEEKKRKEKIEDWDRHLQGKGYRSKTKMREEEPVTKPKTSQEKPKLRQNDYNPLMGSGASCSYRPGRGGGNTGGG